MVALRGKEIDAFLARPDPGRPIILLYGPDAGLVRERADALLASAVDDPNDPFSLVRLDGDELSAEPSRLVDEAMTVPLFGGRRAIRVRAGSRSFASGVDTLADLAVKDCRIVIVAGELRPESPLRKACERAKTAVAIGCYADDANQLARLIDGELRVSHLSIAPDARATLMALLGGDRQASRNELKKLALYAHGKGEVTLDDVMAVVADASELKIDPIVDGAFAGKADLVETEFAKAMIAGTYPGVIISAAQRQAAWLHKSALAVAEGTPVSTLLDSGFPRLHFSRKGSVEVALRNFSPPRLLAIIEQLRRRAGDAQANPAGRRDRAAHAAVDRRECEAAGVIFPLSRLRER
jgi:DNA polymerase-3 subunit delta